MSISDVISKEITHQITTRWDHPSSNNRMLIVYNSFGWEKDISFGGSMKEEAMSDDCQNQMMSELNSMSFLIQSYQMNSVWNDHNMRDFFFFLWNIPLSPHFKDPCECDLIVCLSVHVACGFLWDVFLSVADEGNRDSSFGGVDSRCAVKSSAAKVTRVCLSVCLQASVSAQSHRLQYLCDSDLQNTSTWPPNI